MVYNNRKKLEEITLGDFCGWPRVSSWIMTHMDIKRIVDYSKVVRKPKVLDAGCGNGFASRLLALEGLDVLGVNIQMEAEEAASYGNIPRLKLMQGDVEYIGPYKGRNIIFNSWMPQGNDWSGCFNHSKASLIIYVKSRSTGLQPGMSLNPNNVNTYYTHPKYVEVDRWNCFGNDDLVDENIPVLGSKIGEVIVQAEKQFYQANLEKLQEIKKSITVARPYNWEKQLPK